MRQIILSFSIFLAVATIVAEPVPRSLTFEDRVAAQKAIEQVYWSHRIWPKENPQPKPPLSAVMSDATIRAKVEDYLRKSNAIEIWWKRPITAKQLQAEMERMARNTRDGSTLRELFAALGDDANVIAETLARQTLVDRLIHDWYAVDTRLHADVKARAEASVATCANVDCMESMTGSYRKSRSVLRTEVADAETKLLGDRTPRLDTKEWHDQLRLLARRFNTTADSLPTNRLSGVEETRDAFVVTTILAQDDGEIETASVSWPKRSFDSWWATEASGVGFAIEPSSGSFVVPSVRLTTCTNDTWSATGIEVPDSRTYPTAIWTGSEMIVWGGYESVTQLYVNTGGRYNPSTDTWTATSNGTNLPTARDSHTAVWTGTEMIVWGGFGGDNLSSGGRYNPSTDTWTTTSTGASVPLARYNHTAVWTGTDMIVWGGSAGGLLLNTGGRYNPTTDTWTPTSTGESVPAGRYLHTAVWTGMDMIVWGGDGYGSVINTGGRYNPTTDTWTATSAGANVPEPRDAHTAIWTGSEMIIWGGYDGVSYFNTGGRYNPTTDAWVTTSTGTNVPEPRRFHTSVWSGTEMIVWGGTTDSSPGADTPVNTGGRYNPSTDAWTATSMSANVPGARYSHNSVWTGNEMIVWGGRSTVGSQITGGRYNPTTDAWTATSTGATVPAARYVHTEVWTGTEMIVWVERSFPPRSTRVADITRQPTCGQRHPRTPTSQARASTTLPCGQERR